jgi:hypothetical protein
MPLKSLWLFLRYTRWLVWLAFLGRSVEFVIHRQQHLDPFGRLVRTTELWMFALPLAAISIGCLELLVREKAGITRGPAGKIGLGR